MPKRARLKLVQWLNQDFALLCFSLPEFRERKRESKREREREKCLEAEKMKENETFEGFFFNVMGRAGLNLCMFFLG